MATFTFGKPSKKQQVINAARYYWRSPLTISLIINVLLSISLIICLLGR